MEKQETVKPYVGINSLQSKRWCCIQDAGNGNQWFFEPSISYTRKESIRLLLEGNGLTWEESKSKYDWRCSKIILTLLEL